MKSLYGTACAAVFLVVVGCSGEPPDENVSIAEEADTSVRVRGCTYAVSTVTDTNNLPPTYQVVVSRVASQRCVAGSVTLPTPGLNFINTPPLITSKGGQGMAVSFQFKGSPSGAGAVAAEIVGVCPDLTVVRTEFLAAIAIGTAAVDVTNLFFKGNNLIAQGTKNGTFGPGGAVGTHFTATYPRFLESTAPPVIAVKP